jgi:hypothetical protein
MLHGMLHEPDASEARGVCILLLSPGIKGRVGPHRLYLKLADPLVAAGFHVLRFDYYGLGDSGGELGERVMADMYNSIQGGRYVDDTIAAMDWMASHHGISRFVGSGLCGGSISALLTAQADRRIESLLGIGLPSTLEGGAQNFDRFMTRGQLAPEDKRIAVPSIRRRRDSSGKSGYRLIGAALRDDRTVERKPAPVTPAAGPDNANPLFAPAFIAMLKARPDPPDLQQRRPAPVQFRREVRGAVFRGHRHHRPCVSAIADRRRQSRVVGTALDQRAVAGGPAVARPALPGSRDGFLNQGGSDPAPVSIDQPDVEPGPHNRTRSLSSNARPYGGASTGPSFSRPQLVAHIVCKRGDEAFQRFRTARAATCRRFDQRCRSNRRATNCTLTCWRVFVFRSSPESKVRRALAPISRSAYGTHGSSHPDSLSFRLLRADWCSGSAASPMRRNISRAIRIRHSARVRY